MGYIRGNKSKVWINDRGQMKITIPKAIGRLIHLRNKDYIGWSWESGKVSIYRKIDTLRDESEQKSKIYISYIGQITTTIPKSIGEAMGIRKGDSVEWLLYEGKIILKRVDN